MTKQKTCPVCDRELTEIEDWYYLQLHDLQKDLHERLAALAEAHAKGEHDDGESSG